MSINTNAAARWTQDSCRGASSGDRFAQSSLSEGHDLCETRPTCETHREGHRTLWVCPLPVGFLRSATPHPNTGPSGTSSVRSLLVAMPGAPFVASMLVAMPFVPSSVHAPSSKECPDRIHQTPSGLDTGE